MLQIACCSAWRVIDAAAGNVGDAAGGGGGGGGGADVGGGKVGGTGREPVEGKWWKILASAVWSELSWRQRW